MPLLSDFRQGEVAVWLKHAMLSPFLVIAFVTASIRRHFHYVLQYLALIEVAPPCNRNWRLVVCLTSIPAPNGVIIPPKGNYTCHTRWKVSRLYEKTCQRRFLKVIAWWRWVALTYPWQLAFHACSHTSSSPAEGSCFRSLQDRTRDGVESC
jgi:hypothetical protein